MKLHCSIVVPALHRCVTTPHSYATLWFQRCSGVFQRPALCSIAAPAPHWWILTPHSGSGATLVDSSASFLYKIWGFCVAMVLFSDVFLCSFRVPCRTDGFQRPIPTQPRGSSAARLDSSVSCSRNIVWTTIVHPRHRRTTAASQPGSH